MKESNIYFSSLLEHVGTPVESQQIKQPTIKLYKRNHY